MSLPNYPIAISGSSGVQIPSGAGFFRTSGKIKKPGVLRGEEVVPALALSLWPSDRVASGRRADHPRLFFSKSSIPFLFFFLPSISACICMTMRGGKK